MLPQNFKGTILMKPTQVTFSLCTAITSCFLTTNLIADEFPSIKQGLWVSEVSSGMDNSKMTIKQCVGDSESIKDMFESSKENLQGTCSEFKTETSGSSYISSVTCDLGISKMKSISTASGDFSKEYTVTTKTIMTPAIGGLNGDTSVVTSKYLGDCEAGMKPGDMITPDGKKMNINEMSEKVGKNADQLKKLQDLGKNFDPKAMEQIQKQMQEMMKEQ
jgi:hypothetical protein